MKFHLGQIVATPNALEALGRNGQTALTFIAKHAALEQGLLDDEDHAANAAAIKTGGRIFSAFAMKDGEKVWVITEADRSITTVLLPEDY